MARLDLIKTPKGSYKIITNSRNKNPALIQIASLLMDSNKSSSVKIGVFGCYGGDFETHKTVYSYITNCKERMNSKQYYSWLRGKRQIKKQKENEWQSTELDLSDVLGSLK